MSEKQNIEELISQNRLDEALGELDRMILLQPGDAGLLFQRGKLKWRPDMPDARDRIDLKTSAIDVIPMSWEEIVDTPAPLTVA